MKTIKVAIIANGRMFYGELKVAAKDIATAHDRNQLVNRLEGNCHWIILDDAS